MHDRVPSHFFEQVSIHLNDVFEGRWMGVGVPLWWPARSPDLNHMYFYLW